jgi:DNA ligase D-like protein (predicted 3'-phosphoesterase)
MSAKKDYEKKRDFDKTSEPRGDESYVKESKKPVFVIQKHDASNLHYDFRLEIDETLKSWAVPKGPSTDPSEKRMAIPTEDHPLAYGDFEGVIPENEYGGGAVMIWDRGSFENLKDEKNLKEWYEKGHLEVKLNGEKLKGGYTLVKMTSGNMEGNWLLIKMDDEQADARRKPTSTENKSVKTGRSMDQIRKEDEHEDQ